MILDELELHNFCLYRGQHSVNLAPRGGNGRAKPIVLIGGINGGGKTTILDAIELALYGSQARCARRTPGTYESYLKACIHRGVSATEGACVGLTFRYSTEGVEHVYRLRRRWNLNRKRITEKLTVYKDGERDRPAGENWQELVQELIPIGLARLCFFDAEQIRFLAEDRSGDDALGASIKSLLGLDLVERLIADASVLEARLVESSRAAGGGSSVESAEKEFDACQQRVTALKTERAGLENNRLKAVETLQRAEQEFAREGGTFSEQRSERLEQQVVLRSQRQQLEGDLRTLAASELPLAMVSNPLNDALKQSAIEAKSLESAVLASLLEERDCVIEQTVRSHGVPEEYVKVLADVNTNDRHTRQVGETVPRRLMLSPAAENHLQQLVDSKLETRQNDANRLLDRLGSVVRELDETTRALKMTPTEEAIRDVANRLTEAAKAAGLIEQQCGKLDEEVKQATLARDEAEGRLETVRRKYIDEELESEEALRMATMAIRTQDVMTEFLSRATSAKIDRLAALVTDSFRFLLRKQTLVQAVEIDPQSFAITLLDDHGNLIPKERLSEGEKQIFAISVLWGLAQASPRPLPTIIDTPMARLDSEHRQNLVRRYFPNASHQVIVLSTDTEVGQAYYDDLHSHIAQSYCLKYDETEMRTELTDGYFWDESAVPAEREG